MRAVVTTEHGGPEVLKVAESPVPELRPGAVRIEVRAAGVNFADVMSRLGGYPHSGTPPFVGGFELAGVVTELASGVTGLAVGDRVAAPTRDGAFAEEAVVDHRDVLALPDSVTFPEAAAIPIAYSTAWAALFGTGSLRAAERVLVKAAAGGVGTAALQLAEHAGAEVHGAASPGKHDAIRGFGADAAHDYTAPGWDADLPPYDLVLDPIGGDSFKQSYDLLRPGGRLVAFGAASAFNGGVSGGAGAFDVRGLDPANLIVDSKSVLGLDLRLLWDDRGTLSPWLAPLVPLLAEGVIKPIVFEVRTFAEAAEAHRTLTARRNIGKVVLVP